MELSDEVSTESGSDGVSIHATVEFARTTTRSLPLSVLTSFTANAADSRCLRTLAF